MHLKPYQEAMMARTPIAIRVSPNRDWATFFFARPTALTPQQLTALAAIPNVTSVTPGDPSGDECIIYVTVGQSQGYLVANIYGVVKAINRLLGLQLQIDANDFNRSSSDDDDRPLTNYLYAPPYRGFIASGKSASRIGLGTYLRQQWRWWRITRR
jgi:hypothetical protein